MQFFLIGMARLSKILARCVVIDNLELLLEMSEAVKKKKTGYNCIVIINLSAITCGTITRQR